MKYYIYFIDDKLIFNIFLKTLKYENYNFNLHICLDKNHNESKTQSQLFIVWNLTKRSCQAHVSWFGQVIGNVGENIKITSSPLR